MLVRNFRSVLKKVLQSEQIGMVSISLFRHDLRYYKVNKYMFSETSNQNNKPKPEGSLQSQHPILPPPASKLEEESFDEKPMESSSLGTSMIIISSIALLISYIYLEIESINIKNAKKQPGTNPIRVTSTGKAEIGGDWQLIDTTGKEFSHKDLSGSYYLIYFGFTNCPDICPNSLSKMARALKVVRESKEANLFDIKSVFVSVDPERDTPERIIKFLNYFDERMIGVTGSSNNDPNLKECMRKFKIYASRIDFEDAESVKLGRKAYTIDHTILTYLMSDTNEYVTHLGANLSEHDLAKTILESIVEDRKKKFKGMRI